MPNISATPERIAQSIAEQGYCIVDNALPQHICQGLYQRITELPASTFKGMGIGRGGAFHVDKSYRSDKSHWLTGENQAEQDYLSWMETLRLAVNRQLFMGLLDYEAHFAHYAPKSFYKRHLDAFKGASSRKLTTVYYLNPNWSKVDGGELLMYQDDKSKSPFKTIIPQNNRLVVFLSDAFPHEVLPAQKDRYSIAGWFRLKA
ncbi:MAG: 2OG-Fe(II) oxygenase [Ghiorsea sp.]|nr:2OG-Fe(II) oxygenase [Ghiorsea sp.]